MGLVDALDHAWWPRGHRRNAQPLMLAAKASLQRRRPRKRNAGSIASPPPRLAPVVKVALKQGARGQVHEARRAASTRRPWRSSSACEAGLARRPRRRAGASSQSTSASWSSEPRVVVAGAAVPLAERAQEASRLKAPSRRPTGAPHGRDRRRASWELGVASVSLGRWPVVVRDISPRRCCPALRKPSARRSARSRRRFGLDHYAAERGSAAGRGYS